MGEFSRVIGGILASITRKLGKPYYRANLDDMPRLREMKVKCPVCGGRMHFRVFGEYGFETGNMESFVDFGIRLECDTCDMRITVADWGP